MDLRTHYPYSLLKYGILKTYPSLKKNIKTDVAVLGAGISGALAAYHLQKKGISCVVLDKGHVAMGSTAASTSLIQYEIDTPLYKLIDLVGYKNAIRSYELCLEAIDDLKKISEKVGDKNNFENKCSLQLASYKKDVAGLKKEFKIRKEHNFKIDFLQETEVKNEYGFYAPAALFSYQAGQVDAYLLTHQLLKSLHNPVYDHTNIISIKHYKKSIQLTTEDGFTITAKNLIIACGYESGKYINKKIEELHCTYAIMSEPLQQKEFWKNNCLIWETADPYMYIRTTRDNRILIGGKDTTYFNVHKQLGVLPQKAKSLKQDFEKLFPRLPIKIDFKWAGAFATTKDGLPYVGSVAHLPKTYFALGFGGNGITFSLIAAQMISSAIKREKNNDMNIFSFNR